jgi:hypothetical protein
VKLQSIAARTTLAIGALAVLAFALAAWLITRSVGSVQEASAQRELAALAHREAEAVARSLENHMAQVRGMAAAAEVEAGLPRPSRERLRQLVERNIARDAEALGYWFEMAPDGFDGRDREFTGSREGGYADTKGRISIYFARGSDGVARLQPPNDGEDVLVAEYYPAPRARDGGGWSSRTSTGWTGWTC